MSTPTPSKSPPRRRSSEGRSSVVVLVAAMAVVATAFVSTIVYFETSTMRVRRETDGMLTNGVPSIDHLTDARKTLRTLDGEMDRALVDVIEKRPVELARIDDARREFDSDIRDYRAVPYYALEAELNRQLNLELRRLDDVQQRLTSLLQKHELQAADALENGEWRRRSDVVDDRLRTLIAFNLRHVTQHALRIDEIRRRAAWVGFAVGGGALLLAFAATLVAARAVRRQSWLQEQRAGELEMFSSRVAHDLMSPLSSVSLSLELANEQLRDPAIARMVGRALAVVKRIRGIVDGLLDFARAGGKPTRDARAPVAKVLADVVEEVRPQAQQAAIELRLDEAPPVEVACSPGILAVLVGNLVNNALKYMGDSGTRVVTVRARDVASRACFEVEDTGPGLPAGLATAAAFEPYVRGNGAVGGLGLGLATVKRFVEAHGGSVGVRPRTGGGSIFWFDLPIS